MSTLGWGILDYASRAALLLALAFAIWKAEQRHAPVQPNWVRHVTTTERGESRTLHPVVSYCPACRIEVTR